MCQWPMYILVCIYCHEIMNKFVIDMSFCQSNKHTVGNSTTAMVTDLCRHLTLSKVKIWVLHSFQEYFTYIEPIVKVVICGKYKNLNKITKI